MVKVEQIWLQPNLKIFIFWDIEGMLQKCKERDIGVQHAWNSVPTIYWWECMRGMGRMSEHGSKNQLVVPVDGSELLYLTHSSSMLRAGRCRWAANASPSKRWRACVPAGPSSHACMHAMLCWPVHAEDTWLPSRSCMHACTRKRKRLSCLCLHCTACLPAFVRISSARPGMIASIVGYAAHDDL